jgi:hypothetical protein
MPSLDSNIMAGDYLAKHNIPINPEKILDRTYETALREAFFDIAALHPGEVLKTFLFYKPRMIAWSIPRSLRFNFSGDQSRAVKPAGPPLVPYPTVALGLLLASLAVALVHFGIGAVSTAELRRVAGVTLVSVLFTLPTYFAAWAAPQTSADLLLYCLFAVGVAMGTMLVSLRSAVAMALPATVRPQTGPVGYGV